jgi:hypothetical protein
VVNGLTVAPELAIAAAPGTLDVPDRDAATLGLADGGAELVIPLPADEMLRCYHLGFLVETPAEARLTATVERLDGSRSEAIELRLPAASSVAAVVEVEPAPQAGARMYLRLDSEAASVRLYDLFVIATG